MGNQLADLSPSLFGCQWIHEFHASQHVTVAEERLLWDHVFGEAKGCNWPGAMMMHGWKPIIHRVSTIRGELVSGWKSISTILLVSWSVDISVVYPSQELKGVQYISSGLSNLYPMCQKAEKILIQEGDPGSPSEETPMDDGSMCSEAETSGQDCIPQTFQSGNKHLQRSSKTSVGKQESKLALGNLTYIAIENRDL